MHNTVTVNTWHNKFSKLTNVNKNRFLYFANIIHLWSVLISWLYYFLRVLNFGHKLVQKIVKWSTQKQINFSLSDRREGDQNSVPLHTCLLIRTQGIFEKMKKMPTFPANISSLRVNLPFQIWYQSKAYTINLLFLPSILHQIIPNSQSQNFKITSFRRRFFMDLRKSIRKSQPMHQNT